jgi:hypothetical protein
MNELEELEMEEMDEMEEMENGQEVETIVKPPLTIDMNLVGDYPRLGHTVGMRLGHPPGLVMTIRPSPPTLQPDPLTLPADLSCPDLTCLDQSHLATLATLDNLSDLVNLTFPGQPWPGSKKPYVDHLSLKHCLKYPSNLPQLSHSGTQGSPTQGASRPARRNPFVGFFVKKT